RRARLVLPTPIGPSTTMNRCGVALTCLALGLQNTNSVRTRTPLEIHDAAVSWNIERWGNIVQRIQDEVARRHPGMRQSRPRFLAPRIDHPHKVQIYQARTPALVPLASHPSLDVEQYVEQRASGESSQQTDDGIDEIRLILRSHGAGQIQARSQFEPRLGQCADSLARLLNPL